MLIIILFHSHHSAYFIIGSTIGYSPFHFINFWSMIDNLKGSFGCFLNFDRTAIANAIHYSYSSIFLFHSPLSQPNASTVQFQQKPKQPEFQSLWDHSLFFQCVYIWFSNHSILAPLDSVISPFSLYLLKPT